MFYRARFHMTKVNSIVSDTLYEKYYLEPQLYGSAERPEYSGCQIHALAEIEKCMRIFCLWLGRAQKIYENIRFMARPSSKNI